MLMLCDNHFWDIGKGLRTTLTTCGASDPATIIYGWDIDIYEILVIN